MATAADQLICIWRHVKDSTTFESFGHSICVVPVSPEVERRKYGWSGEMWICSVSLVASRSANTCASHSD